MPSVAKDSAHAALAMGGGEAAGAMPVAVAAAAAPVAAVRALAAAVPKVSLVFAAEEMGRVVAGVRAWQSRGAVCAKRHELQPRAVSDHVEAQTLAAETLLVSSGSHSRVLAEGAGAEQNEFVLHAYLALRERHPAS